MKKVPALGQEFVHCTKPVFCISSILGEKCVDSILGTEKNSENEFNLGYFHIFCIFVLEAGFELELSRFVPRLVESKVFSSVVFQCVTSDP